MKKLPIIFISILLVFSLFVLAEDPACVTPTDGMTITEDTTFCPGTYNLPNGITIGADDVTLDCNHALINSESGIKAHNLNNIEIKNCNISNSGAGISLFNTSFSTVSNNNLEQNEWGIQINRGKNNFLKAHDNIFSSNGIAVRTSEGNYPFYYQKDFGSGKQNSPGKNVFYYNTHDIYHSNPDTLYAKFNDWGTQEHDLINEKIYDQNDNPDFGVVEYEPISSFFVTYQKPYILS